MKKHINHNFKALAIGLGCLTASACNEVKTPPNVILLITDDQGYGDIAAHGNTEVVTPHIDKLHGESARLTNFHVSPTCAPTRASVMTGRYANRVGVWHTVMGRSLLLEGEQTMADVFAENGYATGMFGKWHLGDNYPFAPQDRGFQDVLTHGGGGVGQTPDYWNNDYFNDVYLRNGKPEQTKGYCTDVWFNEALSFIDKNKAKPFFCYISTNAPHGPLNVPTEYVTPYLEKGVPKTRAKFYGMITNIDDNLGRLRTQLEEWKIADNTILIFMTDNGTAFGAGFDKEGKIRSGYNANMRGTKNSPYDGGHRVPFYLHWKDGDINVGRDIEDLTAHIDILPTLMNMCGLKVAKPIDFDGTDISEGLAGEGKIAERTLVGDSQRLEYPEKWRQSYTMTKEWRLVNGEELYNIKEDPSQLTNVAEKYPEVLAKLRKAYEENWADQSPAFKQFPYIKVGTEHEPVAMLTAHDWHVSEELMIPWNHQLIRKGVEGNGEWRVNFTKAGNYEIVLRRYPKEAKLGLNDAAEKLVTEAEGYVLREGKAFNFEKAFVKVGDKVWEQPISENAQEVVFNVEVQEGDNVLSAYFETDEAKQQGAYYAYVTHQPTQAK